MAIKVYKKGDEQKVAKNFRAREFDCHGTGCCCETKIDDKLVEYLQKIREHFGKSVYIDSGYRCAAHNASIPNAASKSKHMDGTAADIVVGGVDPLEIAKYAESIGVKGIGLYETDKDGYFVHVDTRTSKFFWYGHGQEQRTTFGGAPVAVQEGYSMEQFIRDVQDATGSKVDGIAGPETIGNTPTVSRYVNREHAVVEFIQKRLLALGYAEVGKADGIAGAKFTSAVAHFQQDNGCSVDGEITAGKTTWKKLLGVST